MRKKSTPKAEPEVRYPDAAARMAEVIKQIGTNQAGIAQMVGVKDGTVTTWTKGYNLPSVSNLTTLARAIKYPPGALVRHVREGEPLPISIADALHQAHTNGAPAAQRVRREPPNQITPAAPVFKSADMAWNSIHHDLQIHAYEADETMPHPPGYSDGFWFHCEGDSMRGRFEDDAILYASPSAEVADRSYCLVFGLEDNKAVVRRVEFEDGFVKLIPENPRYEKRKYEWRSDNSMQIKLIRIVGEWRKL